MTLEEKQRIRVLLVRFGMDRVPPTTAHVADKLGAIAEAMRVPRERVDAMRDLLASNGADGSAAGQWLSELLAHARMLASLAEALDIWSRMDVQTHRELFGGDDPKQHGMN
jgi:hypothetical protein